MLGIAVVLVITPLKDYYFYQLRAVGAYELMGIGIEISLEVFCLLISRIY